MPSFQKFKASGEKKKKRRTRFTSKNAKDAKDAKDKGLKQKQKQKVIVNVSAGGSGGGGYIPVPQAPDYGSIASMIASLRPPITQDIQLRQAPVYEPVPVKQEETIKSMTLPSFEEVMTVQREMKKGIEGQRSIEGQSLKEEALPFEAMTRRSIEQSKKPRGRPKKEKPGE